MLLNLISREKQFKTQQDTLLFPPGAPKLKSLKGEHVEEENLHTLLIGV